MNELIRTEVGYHIRTTFAYGYAKGKGAKSERINSICDEQIDMLVEKIAYIMTLDSLPRDC